MSAYEVINRASKQPTSPGSATPSKQSTSRRADSTTVFATIVAVVVVGIAGESGAFKDVFSLIHCMYEDMLGTEGLNSFW